MTCNKRDPIRHASTTFCRGSDPPYACSGQEAEAISAMTLCQDTKNLLHVKHMRCHLDQALDYRRCMCRRHSARRLPPRSSVPLLYTQSCMALAKLRLFMPLTSRCFATRGSRLPPTTSLVQHIPPRSTRCATRPCFHFGRFAPLLAS